MIAELITAPLFWAALASCLLGCFGYVLARLVMRPVLGYRSLKRRIRRGLEKRDGTAAQADQFRTWADRLTNYHQETLPRWYRLSLQRRDESPREAARHLMALSNTRNPDHAARRAAKVCRALKLPVP